MTPRRKDQRDSRYGEKEGKAGRPPKVLKNVREGWGIAVSGSGSFPCGLERRGKAELKKSQSLTSKGNSQGLFSG